MLLITSGMGYAQMWRCGGKIGIGEEKTGCGGRGGVSNAVAATLRFIRNAGALGGHGLQGNVAAWRQISGADARAFLGGVEPAKIAPDSSGNIQR
jgi:hypothetical protein